MATLVAEDGSERSLAVSSSAIGARKDMAHSQHVSLPKTFSSGDASEWFKRFEICSQANGWNGETKAKKLPTLLEGEALAIWLELTETEQKDYAVSRKKITEKLLPIGFIPLDEFHKRKLQPGESLSLFVYDLKRLLIQAMPDIDIDTRDQLLLHQFLTGLPLAVSKQLRVSDDAKSLDKAVERARLLMAIEKDQMQTAAVVEAGEVQELRKQISELTEQVALLATSKNETRRGNRTPKRCFNCRGVGHLQRDCPSPRRPQAGERRVCWTCGRPGHVAIDCPQENERGAVALGNRRPRQN